MKIGIDFGGVIIKTSEGEDFNPKLGKTIAIPYAISSISNLAKSNEIFIISKASRRVQAFTREWLSTVNFYQTVPFNPSNLMFCEKRSEKALICREIGIDWFIDDNYEVINSLSGIVPKTALFTDSVSWVNILLEIQDN